MQKVNTRSGQESTVIDAEPPKHTSLQRQKELIPSWLQRNYNDQRHFNATGDQLQGKLSLPTAASAVRWISCHATYDTLSQNGLFRHGFTDCSAGLIANVTQQHPHQ